MEPHLPSTSSDTIQSQSTNHSAATQHIRGSSLLLAGKVLALALDFGAQVLLVRYLSKTHFGAFSYALATVMFFQGLAMFEMPNTVARFVPLYRERKQYRAMFGTLVLAFGVVVGLGTLSSLAIHAGLTLFGLKPSDDPQAIRLLLILAALIPLQGLDNVFTTLFASFGSTRAVFLRQSMLGPGLKILLVAVLIGLKTDVIFLAQGYLAASAIGVLMYAWMFGRMLRRQGWLKERHARQFSYPVRELFGFATPMLVTALVWRLMESSDALLLGYFQGPEAVAMFRVVLPLAQLNQAVILTFSTLYMPLAVRLYAREDHAQLSDLYWQTTLWMTVLSFPIFALTFSFARSMTIGIYGPQYVDSVAILVILSLSYFFHTALGFNGLTLKVFGKLRYAVSADIAAAVLNVTINLLLIPRWGAVGAAIGTASAMIVHNVLKHFGLWSYTGITLFPRKYVGIYATIFGVALILLGLQAVLPASILIALPLGAVAGLVVLWSSRHLLQVDTMFPELRRLPIVRTILQPLLGAS